MVFAVEGPICAGKSTLIDSITESGQTERVREYSEYVRSATLNFPKFPPQDEAKAQRAFEFFLELERFRLRDYQTRSKEVLLDRSVFTLLAFEVGASSITGINILPWAIDRVIQTRNEIIWPDHIIYLDVPVEVSRNRSQVDKIKMPEFQFDLGFNAGFKALFVTVKQVMPVYVTVLDATQTQEKMQSEVLKILKS